MAAAVAAADMEDTFEDAGVAGGRVMGDVMGVSFSSKVMILSRENDDFSVDVR